MVSRSRDGSDWNTAPYGRDAVEVKPGDYFLVPPALVHRDLNPDQKHELVVVNVLVGEGPAVANVGGPKG